MGILTFQSPDALLQQVVRTVSENLRTLRVQNFGFDEQNGVSTP
jgi:hypothetical protein